MADYFDLDFSDKEEQTNPEVLEKNLYPELVKDGFTFSSEPSSGAGYIMTDSKFLFIEQNRVKLDITGKATRGALDFYLVRHQYVQDTEASRILCQTDNAVRINDGSNFSFEVLVGLPKLKPSYEQLDSLENWLYFLISKNKNTVSIGNELVSEVFKVYDLTQEFPEQVCRSISNYYSSGILREAKDIKNIWNNFLELRKSPVVYYIWHRQFVNRSLGERDASLVRVRT